MVVQVLSFVYVAAKRLRYQTELINYKAISITYSECVFVALGVQHANPHLLRSIIFSSVKTFCTHHLII
jgi:hypothetical protein